MGHGLLSTGAGAGASDPLSVTVSEGAAAVRLTGDVDLATVSSLRSRLHELVINGHVHLAVELDAVTFMDSSGLGVLVAAQREVRVFRGSLVLVAPSPPVRRLLSLTSLDKVFDVRPDARDGR